MPYLILVRHGKSEWNALNLWTGWRDIPLHPDGREEARITGRQLQDIVIHQAYTSKLERAKETLEIIKSTLKIDNVPTVIHEALNERNYGIFTGQDKWKIKEEIGEVEFQKIRRSWNHPIPEGETLEDVYHRVIPYYKKTIQADLRNGKNVIVVAHGNSLRALVKHLENLSNEEVVNLEIGIAEAHIYQINERGRILSKEIRAENKKRGKI
jgi:2,3-bisphosphoglycerate-dependent phosphoglycerate mutase